MAPKEQERPESGLWKDFLDRSRLEKIAAALKGGHPRFKSEQFIDTLLSNGFLNLELKQRMDAIAEALVPFLPRDYKQAVKIIEKAAPQVRTFENWALLSYVEKFGLEHFDISVETMKLLTQYSTAEFAIRPYMTRYTARMMPILHQWAEDENEHIRRLAAEGSRPRGVWVAHIETFRKDPKPVLELLEKLKADPSLYVRKAVANNLNDISKDHPNLVIKTALRWQKDKNPHTDWIIKRACRSLIKAGHPEVMPLFGFDASPKIKIENLKISPKKIKIGGKAIVSFVLKSETRKSQKLVIDYCVHYLKNNGSHSKKVFKLTEQELPALAGIPFKFEQSFVNLSTRKHYPGTHQIDILVNGKVSGSVKFTLTR